MLRLSFALKMRAFAGSARQATSGVNCWTKFSHKNVAQPYRYLRRQSKNLSSIGSGIRAAKYSDQLTSTETAMASLKLHYFELPGRAEVARLCFTVGNVPYEEVTYEFKTWPEHKAKMPFGQVPVLELADGKMIAQSGAIDRYAAKLGGLYPEDPVQAALADQACFQMADTWDLFLPTFRLSPEEKVKARQELIAGKVKEKLEQLAKLLDASGEYVAGDKLSYGDLSVFVGLSNLISGFLDGVPADLLDSYPTLKAYRSRIASLPAVKAYYEKRGEGLRAAFKPDAAAA